MKMNEPIGNAIYGPLLVRLPLGVFFILTGQSIYRIPVHNFIAQVKSYHMLPDTLAVLYAVLLPYLEIAAGILIVLGLYTTLAAMLTSLMIVSVFFIFSKATWTISILHRDLPLLGASLSLLYTGAGAFSIDRFRKSG